MKSIYITIAILSSIVLFSQNKTIVPKNEAIVSDAIDMKCPYYSFGNFRIKEFITIDSIDNRIAKLANGYIEKIIGKKLMKRIYFSNGRELNLDIQKQYNPKSENKTKYFLCYGFSDEKKGIKNYGIYLELDADGKLMNDINLPACNKKATCFNLINLEEAKMAARKKGFFKDGKTKVELIVHETKKVFSWSFINESYENKGIYLMEELLFNANTGDFIELRKTQGEWVE